MPPFHHSAYFISQFVLLESTALLYVTLPAPELHHMHQFGIAINNDVWIVGDNNKLATQLIFANLPHDQVVDKVVVEIVFRLVENNGFLTESCQLLSRLY